MIKLSFNNASVKIMFIFASSYGTLNIYINMKLGRLRKKQVSGRVYSS
jgi:hypothetical protein